MVQHIKGQGQPMECIPHVHAKIFLITNKGY